MPVIGQFIFLNFFPKETKNLIEEKTGHIWAFCLANIIANSNQINEYT